MLRAIWIAILCAFGKHPAAALLFYPDHNRRQTRTLCTSCGNNLEDEPWEAA